MKLFVLLFFVVAASNITYSQTYYRTAQTGDYNNNATWVGGAAGRPLATANTPACNCKIVINPGHLLRVNVNLSLTNAFFILIGASSQLQLTGNGTNVILSGTSGIDIRTASGSLIRGQNNQFIRIGTTNVWTDDFEFQSTTNGTVQGIASVHSGNTTWSSVALPVKLTEFSASKAAKGISLTWKTSTEVNSSHFDIERSTDSKSWNAIGTVNAAGNTGVEQTYSFTDVAPADGDNYYRLKMVDIDASHEYSPIKSVSFAASGLNVVVGPNPATSFINVKVSMQGNQPYRLRLINRAGQTVFNQRYTASGNSIQLNVANYADGSYFLEVSNDSGLKQIQKVMVVRK